MPFYTSDITQPQQNLKNFNSEYTSTEAEDISLTDEMSVTNHLTSEGRTDTKLQ